MKSELTVATRLLAACFASAALFPACTSKNPVAPGATSATLSVVFSGPTARLPNLTRDQEECARFVGPTHVHASWRSFESTNMSAVGSDRWEVTLQNVPTGQRLSILVADQNACVQDPDGWVTRNVTANGVTLTDVVNVNNGRGFGLTVGSDGRVTP